MIVGNGWYQTEGPQRAVVAGARREDWDQGIVSVTTMGGPSGIYETPRRAGPLTIVDAVGERLALRASDGTAYVFDVSTGRFVDSLHSSGQMEPD